MDVLPIAINDITEDIRQVVNKKSVKVFQPTSKNDPKNVDRKFLTKANRQKLTKVENSRSPVRSDKSAQSEKTSAENEAVKESAQDFEAVFLTQLLTQMRETTKQGDESLLGEDKTTMKIFNSMLDEKLASEMAKTGQIGLAELMFDQLSNHMAQKADSTDENASEVPSDLTVDLTDVELELDSETLETIDAEELAPIESEKALENIAIPEVELASEEVPIDVEEIPAITEEAIEVQPETGNSFVPSEPEVTTPEETKTEVDEQSFVPVSEVLNRSKLTEKSKQAEQTQKPIEPTKVELKTQPPAPEIPEVVIAPIGNENFSSEVEQVELPPVSEGESKDSTLLAKLKVDRQQNIPKVLQNLQQSTRNSQTRTVEQPTTQPIDANSTSTQQIVLNLNQAQSLDANVLMASMNGATVSETGGNVGSQLIDSGQVMIQIVNKATPQLAKGGIQEAIIDLEPPSLGKINIKLTFDDSGLSAKIHARNGMVSEIVRGNLAQLRNALSEQGIQIDTFQVTSDGQSSQNYSSTSSQQQGQQFDGWENSNHSNYQNQQPHNSIEQRNIIAARHSAPAGNSSGNSFQSDGSFSLDRLV